MFDQIIVFAVILATLVMFLINRLRFDLVAVSALLVLALTRIIKPDHVFDGFANPAVITIADVMIISSVLRKAGVVDELTRFLARHIKKPFTQLVALTSAVAASSGLVNDTGALGVFMPVALQLARRGKTSPSRLLMPLSFSAFLGGLLTLIGTPPNIIIANYRATLGHKAFGMFAFTPVGAGVAAAGLGFMWLASGFLVPRRRAAGNSEDPLNIASYVTEAQLGADSPFIGVSLGQIETEIDATFAVIGLVRDDKPLNAPPRYSILRAGDILIIEADAENLQIVLDEAKLTLSESKTLAEQFIISKEINVVECIVGAESRLIGRSATTMRLRQRFGVNLLALSRKGKRMQGRPSDTAMRTGDVLLIQGDGQLLADELPRLGCLPLIERDLRLGKPSRIMLALGIFLIAIIAAASSYVATPIAFTAAILAMVLTGLISPRELYEDIEWPIIVLLGAIIPIGGALESTGGAALIAHGLIGLAHHIPAWSLIGLLLIVTMLLSNVINHAATAVLMAPIAADVAHSLNVSADPLLMAIAVGASLPFLTPIGHPCNLLVMGPGGYKFSDYARLGTPLTIITALVAVPLLMFVWPLH
ncbi:MAG TPA: SLC13 family permease [Acetobacteraceae bacterium]|nr:SLC13 family permease [Acetobacteraceae bacterium]